MKEAETIMKVVKTRSGVVFADVSSLFTSNNPFSILFSPSIFLAQSLKELKWSQKSRTIGRKKEQERYIDQMRTMLFFLWIS